MNFIVGKNVQNTKKLAHGIHSAMYKSSQVVISRFRHNPLDETSFITRRIVALSDVNGSENDSFIKIDRRKMYKLNLNITRL